MQHRKFLMALGILFCLLLFSGSFYRIFGHRLIESIYQGRSLPFLNRLIKDQTCRPVEIYHDYADTLFYRFRGYLVSILFFFFIYFLYTLISRIKSQKLKNVVFSLLMIVATLGCVEIFLNYVMPVQIGEITFANFQPSPNPRIIIEPRPSTGEFNSKGFRDYEYSRENPDGVYRIVVIGDSLAYGLRVALEDTYTKQLEKKLNERSADGRRFEVINMGVPGYRTLQIVERFKERGLKYQPDLVIYGYWLDDISFSGLVPFYFSRVNLDMSEKINRLMAMSPAKRKMKKFLLDSQIVRRCILLAREFQRRREGEKAEEDVFPVEEKMKELEPAIRDLFQDYRGKLAQGTYTDAPGGEPYFARYAVFDDFVLWNSSMKEFSGICRERDIRCLLLMTPVIYDYEDGNYAWEGLHRFIRAIAEHYSIPVIDLTDAFHEHEAYRLRAGDLEHPSALGHQIIADALYKWVVNEPE